MNDNGIVTIKDLWLKNVWEICRSMDGWALNVQYKNKVIHKIRPAKWYGTGNRSRFPMFSNLEDYLSAIEETLFSYPATHELSKGWRKKIINSYKSFYNKQLSIPRWDELEETYQPPVKKRKK